MRVLKILLVAVLLAAPIMSAAGPNDIPGSADWYLHVDLKQMKSEEAGKPLYDWLRDEAFDDVKNDAGIDIEQEIDSLTAFSITGEGPVIVVAGNFSTETRDKIMAIIAAEGDITPLEASGRKYYRLGDDDGNINYSEGDLDISLDSLEDGGWISMDVKDKILITGTEERMKALLANKGRILSLIHISEPTRH